MNKYTLIDFVSILKGNKKQTQKLRKFNGDEFWIEWTFLFEDINKNIQDEIILDGVIIRNKYIPFIYKKIYFSFHTDNNNVYIKNSFSENNKIYVAPIGEKVGIKFIRDLKTNTLVSIISSTDTDYAIQDTIELGYFNKLIKTIGLQSKKKQKKNILIKTLLPKNT